MTFTTAELIKCARREVRMRKLAYPRWVCNSQMTQEKADRETQCMEAIVFFLETHDLSRQEKQEQGYLL